MRNLRILLFGLSAFFYLSCMPAINVTPEIDPAVYPEPQKNAITFWGHATSYIDVGGVGIITDPVFAGAYSPFHRREVPSPPRQAFDQTKIILISHAHFDHLHPETLVQFDPETIVLCPELSAEHVQKSGLEPRVMKPGDEFPFDGGKIVAVAAHHPGGRLSLKARHDGNALGYVIYTSDETIYYSGDTEYFEGLREIGIDHDPDIAILNINSHLDSYDAVRAVAALGVPQVIPSHYGAYGGSNDKNAPRRLSELEDLLGKRMVTRLSVGKSYSLEDVRGELAAKRSGTSKTIVQ